MAAGRILVIGDTGGTSSIKGYIEATGGTGGYINSVPGSHHSGVHGNSDPNGGIGGVPNGRDGKYRYDSNEGGGRGPLQPGKGWALSLTKTDGTYGQGGLSRHLRNIRSVWVCCATGGSGGYDSKTITVKPGEVLTINVGAGGDGISGGLDNYKHICWAEPGNDGFVLIQYEDITKDYYINATNTIDEAAKDKIKPAILELFLNGILGDETKYEIGMVSEDYGTLYEHYIVGSNKTYNMTVTSNILETEVITGIAGYSWKIDKNEYGEPDNVVGYDNDSNKTKTFPATIATTYLDKGNYLHVKPIDGAGNIGDTVHLELETTTITLTSHYNEYADKNGYGPNYVPLSWTNSNPNDKFFYKLFQKNEGDTNWTQVSTNYGKAVKVLNVYPNVGNQLKKWMETRNSEEPNGYGKGLITVDEVRITDFNRNPDGYLKKNGVYQYDVIMFGSWDCNNDYDLSSSAALATERFIKEGRGVLFGHDTICDYGGMGHHNFNYLAKYVKATPTRNVSRVGSSTVKVIKKGFLTKYPYDIETRNLTVPYCHTSGVLVYSDIWIKFLNLGGPLTDGPDVGYNNYYLASWNNCAFIRTGHSNGAATPDEQKILANVLFYLGQVTDDTEAEVRTAEDLAAPEVSNVQISDNKKQNKLEFAIEGIDHGTAYDHYVTAMKLLTAGTYYSNTVHTIVKTGIDKFQYTINSSATTYSGTQFEVKATNKEKCSISIDKSYVGQYLHIRPVDIAGNVGEVTHIYIAGHETISKEEKDKTEELYCIEEDVLIPSEYDGTSTDATVEVGTRKEVLKWPLDIQKIFELYKEDGVALRNPYTTSGQNGFVDKSNSLGRYMVSSTPGTQAGKKGNAREVYAYILAHYKDNTTENSASQNALYEIIAEEEGRSGDNSRRNTLYYEAKEYAKYRELLKTKGGFFTNQVTHNVKVGYNVENAQFIVGPFELNYVRSQTTITDEKGNKKKLDFSGIGVASGTKITNKNGIRIYDQNGKEIPQNTWTIEYDNKAQKEKTRTETYSEYGMPLPGEEFYIKLNKNGNEQVEEISKIEVEYYELEADARYRILSGLYNTVEWNAYGDANKCEGGTMCPHDREYPHTIGHTYYVKSEILAANIASQKLLEVEWAKLEYKQHVQELKLTANKGTNIDNGGEDGSDDGDNGGYIEDKIRLTMNFSGSIWNDKNENISNGLKENGEKGIKGVEVFLIDVNTNKQTDYTVTDENGKYTFHKVPVGTYYIQYTYDGQTYKTTKSFVKGNVENYRENGNGTYYSNVSIVEETNTERQNFNNKFYEIKENQAIATDGAIRTLQYKQVGTTSIIQTREEGTEKAYQDFQIKVDTKQKDIYFPATNTIIVNNTPYLVIDDNNNINVGLSEREKTDTNLKLDVYQTIFSLKGQRQSFLHNGKQIRELNSNSVVNEYIQKINPDDYYWRIEDYKEKVSEETYNKIINIYGNNPNEAGNKLELETYVEYMIIIRNSGSNDTAYITEIADYYDKSLYYNANGYRDFDMSSWLVIRNDDETESVYTGNNSKQEIKWSEKSRYGDKNDYSEYLNKMYANLQDYGIKEGQYAEIHIIFQVLKDGNGNIMLNAGAGKNNVAEINGYRTLESATGNVAGLIDADSKPGDVNPLEPATVYDDDEDKAPEYKLVLDTNISGGNAGSGNGAGGNTGNENGGNGAGLETDENGNVIGYGNTIEGNVWEDLKDYANPLEDGRVISNGIKEENEPLVNNVKVDLLETIGGKNKTGVYEEIEINLCEKQEVRTGNNVLLLTDKTTSNGAYRFSHLTSGRYRVQFTYGDEKQLTEELKYNGQDYQALSSDRINKTDKIAGSYEQTEIMIVIDNSNSMSGVKMTQAKLAANSLLSNLKDRLPGVEIGVINFNELTNTIGKVSATTTILTNGINNLTAGGETAIGRGISTGISGFEDGKIKLMILITDGHETVETEEDVIQKIEELRHKNIQLVTMLTSESTNIFGDKEVPRYGKIFEIEENANLENEFKSAINSIYEEIVKESQIGTDRSLGDDKEGTEDTPRTRRWQIARYAEMDYEKSKELDIEGISKLANGSTAKQEAIKKLELYTAMESVTSMIEIKPNNIDANQIHEVNQALVERPKAKLQLTQEINGIKVILSDGSILIDTAKGISKNVNGLEQEVPPGQPQLPISIYMDEEIMHGATVEVSYSLKIINVGEIDRLSNYFEGASDSTIPTSAKVIYAYLNNNIVYREADNKHENEEGTLENTWGIATEDDWEIELAPDTVDGLENIAKITLRTTALEGKPLYPETSKEVKNGVENCASSVGVELTLSKLISPEDESSTTLTYDCTMELTVRGNEVGRRIEGSVLGNHKVVDLRDLEEGTTISLEPDETMSRSVVITKPFGENRDNSYVLYLAGLGGVIAISLIGIVLCNRKK